MLLITYFVLLGLNLFFAIREKRSAFVVVVTLFFAWFLITGSRSIYDLDFYIKSYENINRTSVDGLQVTFFLLKKLFYSFKFTFFEFRGYVVLFALILMHFFFKKTTSNVHILYVAYMVYLIFLDYIQLKNFLACSVLCVAFIVFLQHKNYWRFFYFCLIFFAGTIHSSFFIYLLFLLIPANLSFNARVIKIFAIGALVFTFFSVFYRENLHFITDILFLIDDEKSVKYAETTTTYGALYFVGLQIYATVVMLFMSSQYKQLQYPQYTLSCKNEILDVRKSLKLICLVNLVSFAFCPFIVFNINFYRLLRNLYLLNIVGFSLFGIKNRPFWVLILLLGYVFLWVYIDLLGHDFQNLVTPLFKTNVYLKN